jgi:hypothetical protein
VRRVSRKARNAILQTLGFGLISYALGMWILEVGIGFAGVSLIVLAWLSDEPVQG